MAAAGMEGAAAAIAAMVAAGMGAGEVEEERRAGAERTATQPALGPTPIGS